MAAEAPLLRPDQSPEERLDQLVQFLGEKGFTARWAKQGDDHLVWVLACPHRRVAREHNQVCHLDMQIIQDMLKVNPVRLTCMADDDRCCTYYISQPD